VLPLLLLTHTLSNTEPSFFYSNHVFIEGIVEVY
jgi:hypothetical protein